MPSFKEGQRKALQYERLSVRAETMEATVVLAHSYSITIARSHEVPYAKRDGTVLSRIMCQPDHAHHVSRRLCAGGVRMRM